jgi:hypothetical protein
MTDALRNALARAAREASMRNQSKMVRLPLKDVPEGPGHLAKSSDYIYSNALSWGQKLDELTPAARNAGPISGAMRDRLCAKYGKT